MQTLEVTPKFIESRESASIISTNSINLPKTMPLLNKIYIETPSSGQPSSNSINFSAANLASYIDSTFDLKLDFELSIQGGTCQPGGYGAAGAPSHDRALCGPPHLFTGGIEPFALNRLVQSIDYQIANKSWNDNLRFPEDMDFFSSQFDLEKCKENGIENFEDRGVLMHRKYKQPIVKNADFNRLGYITTDVVSLTGAAQPLAPYPYLGFETSRQSDKLDWLQKQLEKGYIEILDCTFTTTETQTNPNLTLESSNWNVDHTYGYKMPYAIVKNAGGVADLTVGQPYYSVRSSQAANLVYVLTQNLTIRVNESLCAPSTSNKYSKNPMGRSYPTLGQSVNIKLNLNEDYINNMFMVTPVMGNIFGTAVTPNPLQTGLVASVTPQIVAASIGFYTFDSNKPQFSDDVRCLYSHLDRQTIPMIVSDCSQTQEQYTTATTGNLQRLPPYLLIYVIMRCKNNSDFLSSVQMSPSNAAYVQSSLTCFRNYILQKITTLKIEYGAQGDVLSSDMNMRQINDLMMMTLDNKSIRDVITGVQHIGVCSPIFDLGDAITDSFWGNVNNQTWTVSDMNSFLTAFHKRPNAFETGCPFVLLDTSLLNFRSVTNNVIPTISEFDYGSNNYKSLRVTIGFEPNSDMLAETGFDSAVEINYEPNFVLCTRKIRSLPFNSNGIISEQDVVFDFFNDKERLTKELVSYYSKNDSSELAKDAITYVGGLSFGDFSKSLSGHLKRFLPYVVTGLPLVFKGIHTVANLTKPFAGDNSLLGKAHKYSSYASKGLKSVGLGARK